MSDMNLGRHWIDTELDDEFLSGSEFFLEIFSVDDASDSLAQEIMYLRISHKLLTRGFVIRLKML